MFIKTTIKSVLWRLKNRHNYTQASGANFPINLVTVGKGTYGKIRAISYGSAGEHLEIGNYCSIADEVSFLLGGEHVLNRIATYPFRSMFGRGIDSISKGEIILEDDVWVGYGATILSGVRIGQGAVVGARALVTKDVPPYAVVAGVPAKIIKMRFEDIDLAELQQLDFRQLKLSRCERFLELLETEVSQKTLPIIKEELFKG